MKKLGMIVILLAVLGTLQARELEVTVEVITSISTDVKQHNIWMYFGQDSLMLDPSETKPVGKMVRVGELGPGDPPGSTLRGTFNIEATGAGFVYAAATATDFSGNLSETITVSGPASVDSDAPRAPIFISIDNIFDPENPEED